MESSQHTQALNAVHDSLAASHWRDGKDDRATHDLQHGLAGSEVARVDQRNQSARHLASEAGNQVQHEDLDTNAEGVATRFFEKPGGSSECRDAQEQNAAAQEDLIPHEDAHELRGHSGRTPALRGPRSAVKRLDFSRNHVARQRFSSSEILLASKRRILLRICMSCFVSSFRPSWLRRRLSLPRSRRSRPRLCFDAF